jgi:hypothetical protein
MNECGAFVNEWTAEIPVSFVQHEYHVNCAGKKLGPLQPEAGDYLPEVC